MTDEALSIIRRLIEQRFKSQWALVGNGIPAEYEGVPFYAPAGGKYVRLSVRFADHLPVSTTGRVSIERQPGLAYVNIFWPKRESNAPAVEIAEKVSKIFCYYRETSEGVSLTFKKPDPPVVYLAGLMTTTVAMEFDSRVTITTT